MSFLQTFYIQHPGQEPFLEMGTELCPLLPAGAMTLQRNDGIIFKRYFYCIMKIDLDGSIKIFHNKPSLALIISYKAMGLTAIFAKDGAITLKNAKGQVESWSGPVPAVEEEGIILQWTDFFEEDNCSNSYCISCDSPCDGKFCTSSCRWEWIGSGAGDN